MEHLEQGRSDRPGAAGGSRQGPSLPTGTVTFLLTDVEGSTRLWGAHPHAMFQAMARHHQLLHQIIENNEGLLPRDQGEGDSIFAAFARATDAVAAAVQLQLALKAEPWPEGVIPRVRVALHTGEAEVRDGNYYGQSVSRCARLRSLAHGGQVLMSRTTYDLVRDVMPLDASAKDLGWHSLKDFENPENAWQLVHADLVAEFPPLVSVDDRADRLPAQLTSFVGRQEEIRRVKELLSSSRLVTLTGPGGCGKTRLAIEVGKQLIADFSDGVHLVALASLNDPTLVVPAIAKSIGLQESATESPLEGVRNFLRNKQMLLILDNFERVVDAAGDVAELLSEAPGLEFLVTSRATLRLQSEQEFPVPPLGLPRMGEGQLIDSVKHFEAVQLFEERARAAKPDFTITPENAADVLDIVRRLDGLPLAIELAAVRVKLLPPAALLKRLSSRLGLLTGGPRDLPARQQTLRNAIDWDYELLAEEEQKLFRRLAAFAQGFDLESAYEVAQAAGDPGMDVLDGVESMVGKSLLRQVHSPEGDPRFAMLQTIREYALEVLTESGEADVTRQRHAEVYLELAKRAVPELRGPEQIKWLERLELEHDNFRTALTWAGEQSDRELEMKLVAVLMYFWSIRGHLSEARKWAESALGRSVGARTYERSEILGGAALLARARTDYDAAVAFLSESLEIQRELGLKRGIAETIKALGNIEADQNRLDAAGEYYEESLALWRQLNDTLGMSQTLNNLGYLARTQGRAEAAIEMLDESLELFRQMEDKQGIARCLMNLAGATRDLGRVKESGDLAKESLILWRQLGDTWDVADCLDELALVAVEIGELHRSARLFGASEALRKAIGARRPPAEQAFCMKGIEAARSQLGRNAFTDVWQEGIRMRMEEAIDHALEVGSEESGASTRTA